MTAAAVSTRDVGNTSASDSTRSLGRRAGGSPVRKLRNPAALAGAFTLAFSATLCGIGRDARAGGPDRPAASSLERLVLEAGDVLVVSREPERATVTLCIAEHGALPRPLAEPVELARRGGAEEDSTDPDVSMACLSLPPGEISYALFLAGAHLRRAGETGASGSASVPAMARALALEGRADERHAEPTARALSLVGPIGADVASLVAPYLGKVQSAADRAPAPWTLRQTSERLSVLDGDRDTPRVDYSWAVPDAGPDESAALAVAFEILAGGDDSRFRHLLISRGLARTAEAWSLAERGGAVSGVGVESSSRGSLDRIRRFVDGALKQLRLVGPTAREVARAGARLRLRFLQTWDAPAARAVLLAGAELSVGDARRPLAVLSAFDAVTPERVRRAVHDRVVDTRRTTIEIYPRTWPADDPALARHRLYTVLVGDTIDVLAARFHVDAVQLSRDNDLDPRYRLTPGQPLWIPPN